MKNRYFILQTIVFALVLGTAVMSYAAADDPSDDATGTVTKISDKTVTVKEASGTERTLTVKDLKGLKTGDFVIIDDLKVKKINPERKKGLDIK